MEKIRNVHEDHIMWLGAKVLVNFLESLSDASKKYLKSESARNSMLKICLEHWDDVLEGQMILSYDEKKKVFKHVNKYEQKFFRIRK